MGRNANRSKLSARCSSLTVPNFPAVRRSRDLNCKLGVDGRPIPGFSPGCARWILMFSPERQTLKSVDWMGPDDHMPARDRE